MKRAIQHILFLLLFLAGASPLWAQSGKIVGKVIDAETGEPLPGANVIIDGTTIGASTNAKGEYLILNVHPGTYDLVCRYIGFASNKVEGVVVRTDLTTHQDFKLKTETVKGQEVVVQAKQPLIIKDQTSSDSRVSSSEISKLPVQELKDVVQLQAGVNVDNSGAIHIRGGRSSEVSYVVDGIPVTDNYDHSQGLRVENNSVQELQVISGTFNAEYGQAMSGIINIVTKAGSNKFHANAKGYGGGYLTGLGSIYDGIPAIPQNYRPDGQYDYTASVSGPIIKDKITFFATGRRFHNDGWLYGRNAYSPHGPYQDTLKAGADLSSYRTNYNEKVDVSKPWYTLTPDTIRGQAYNILRDSGRRDSSLVSMNPYDSYSFQGNMQFNVSKHLRFNLIPAYGHEEGQNYNHQHSLVATGIPTYYKENYAINLKTTVTPSDRTYITLNTAIKSNRYKSYEFANPFDPRYFNYDDITKYGGRANGGQYIFDQLGTNNNRFKRSTSSLIIKGEVTSQINEHHLVKVGAQLQADLVKYENIDLQPLSPSEGITLPDSIPQERQRMIELGIPPLNTTSHSKFEQKPYNLSAFAQDKIEYQNFIVNVGLRFDYFQANGHIPADPQDPDITNPIKKENRDKTLAQREKYWWKPTTAKYQLSPRLGVAYPISANGVIHFSYGYFFQMPSYEYLYANSQILLPQSSGTFGIFGNPNLKPESTVQYELGLKQKIFSGTAIEVTGYYKDTRNYVSSGIIQRTYNETIGYSTWINRDYSNSKGLTFSLNQNISRQFNFNVDYTYSVVRGSNSDPSTAFLLATATGSDNGQTLTKFIRVLNWDRTSILNASMFYTQNNWSINLLGKYQSGTPYTPSTPFTVRRGPTASQRNLTNTARLPNRFEIDLNADKTIKLGNGATFKIFAYVYNLLGSKLVNNVYSDSGSPERPLIIPAGISPGYLTDPSNYAEPRRIQIGAQISF